MARVIVIGGASLDVLHFRGRTERSPGGAGLYTSLAAHRAGARVTMVGPRPVPVPPELEEAASRIDWRGPAVPPERLPSFEIAHLGGGRAELRGAHWRAEAEMSIDAMPDDLPPGLVFCICLVDPRLQLALVRHFKAQGRTVGCGTYSGAVANYRDVVHEILDAADIFFCNENEATGLFGGLDAARTAPGKLLFVTRGERGARIYQGEDWTEIPAAAVEELDPTGAGDTFCGTVLAGLSQGEHPVQAARQAVAAAGEMVTDVGPSALLRSPPVAKDPGVRIDGDRLRVLAELLGQQRDVAAFDFTGEDYPPVDHPATLDFFFAATLQQFGFWTSQDGRYLEPFIAPLSGRQLKGSDFLWAAYRGWLDDDPPGLTPRGQERLQGSELEERLRAGDGRQMPSMNLRLDLARAYGRDMGALGWTPQTLIERANASSRPFRAFLEQLDHVGGYKEDPLRKKAVLLGLILQQRPESFLRRATDETVPPCVDYHVQRGCLRTGLVRVDDAALRRRLEARQVLEEREERRIREACFDAMLQLVAVSGRSMGAIDAFFFQNRRRCLEMGPPECEDCLAEPACARHVELFQPVLRTSFY